MSTRSQVFSSDFTDTPYWWKDWRPHDDLMSEVPREVDAAIVGAGYAGLSCALEFAKHGLSVAVLEADVPGIGASTLSGGQVSGGVNVGKAPSGKKLDTPYRNIASTRCCVKPRLPTAYSKAFSGTTQSNALM